MLDPKWNEYRDQNTAMYKSASNTDGENARLGKMIAIMLLVMVGIIVLVVVMTN